MKISKSTVRGLLYSTIKKSAEKLKIELIDLKTSDELLAEIKDKDEETYILLKDFIKTFKLANKKDTEKKQSNLNSARNALLSKLDKLS
jgi:hypothetical protein